ncbi:Imm74 family immunity protein [Pectinatus brassicae]|uniref:Immunity protein 74 n=1 Tax=Pectinatus brassicae TaxID=862415 RepID=A0A840UL41_9FIRM|nr:Imm74 family immunity protein [Pectinatus brassicae]MBB5335428.1 hypothetical protein [Pectinatus brassicae]
MKIVGTKSYIKVEIEGKKLIIKGELLQGGFIAYRASIKNWEAPYESEVINDIEKEKIIASIINQTSNSHLIITFE